MQRSYGPSPSASHPSPGLGMRLLNFWYRLAAPPMPPSNAPLLAREVARRARVTSLVMLVTISMVLLAFLVQPTVDISITLLVVTSIDVVALAFNRRGKITVAGVIITMTTELGLLLSLVNTLHKNGGISFNVAVFLPLLVQGIVVAVSTLPPLSVLLILVVNCGVAVGVITFTPYAPAFLAYLHRYEPQTFGNMVITPLTVYLIVGLVSLIWVLSANDAIKRADKADARAEYEQEMAQWERVASNKLNADIHVIAQIIAQLATDPSREFHLDRSNSLWVLARGLNNLRGRLLNVKFERTQFQQTQQAATALTSWLDMAQRTGQFSPWTPSRTIMDEIIFRIQMLPLAQKGRTTAENRRSPDSATQRIEQEYQRLNQGALQLVAALRSSQPTPWRPTGTVLDEVAEQLFSPQSMHGQQRTSQSWPHTTRSRSRPG
jgi:hypothetical protein